MVVAEGSNVAKFKWRKGKDSASHLVTIDDKSNEYLSITNGGCFSSLAEEDRDPSCVSCTTFNILAPIYKRLDPRVSFSFPTVMCSYGSCYMEYYYVSTCGFWMGTLNFLFIYRFFASLSRGFCFKQNQSLRESDFRSVWSARNEIILDWLLYESSTIICLQEFWIGNEELVHMYVERLGDAGYLLFKLPRTNNRGDGLLTAIREKYLSVVNYRELLFNDFGDRVAQLLHVQSVSPLVQNQTGSFHQEFLIVNTHLLFPHDSSLSIVRLHQAYQILQYVELYQRENKLKSMPIILCGDWNGSKRGHVYKFLRSQGFVSSYDIARQYTDGDADAHKWISHLNHRGNICGVDFIWLCNPNQARKSLKTSWAEAGLSILKYQLLEASLSEADAFAFLKGDNCDDFVTYSSFSEALRQVIGVPDGRCTQELKDLWNEADTDGNGILDIDEFKQKIWNSTCPELVLENFNGCKEDDNTECEQEAIGFKVKEAMLFPREVENGLWPKDYYLSDHARLTVVFSPAKLRYSRSQNCS